MSKSMKWTGNTLEILDQTKLPLVKDYVICKDYRDVRDAIQGMKVRGARHRCQCCLWYGFSCL